MTQAGDESSGEIKADIGEIGLEIINKSNIAETLIPKTKISLEMITEVKKENSSNNMTIVVTPIQINLALRHLFFFASTMPRLLSSASILQEASSGKPQEVIKNTKPNIPVDIKIKSTTILKADLAEFGITINDDSMGDEMQYPWFRLALSKAHIDTQLEASKEGNSTKFNASLSSVVLKIAKMVEISQGPLFSNFIEDFKKKRGSSIAPYKTLL